MRGSGCVFVCVGWTEGDEWADEKYVLLSHRLTCFNPISVHYSSPIQQLRLIQDAIRREEEALAAVRREETRRRAEAEVEEKSTYYAMRAAQRDVQLGERKQDLEFQRATRAEEARQRAQYNKQRVDHAAAVEEAKRDRLAAKVQVRCVLLMLSLCQAADGRVYVRIRILHQLYTMRTPPLLSPHRPSSPGWSA